jgi:hypothetical protein
MSNLYKNSEPMRRVVNHLNQYFETDLRR